jgi:transposase
MDDHDLPRALRHDRVEVPWLLEGPINGESFRLDVDQVLIPTLQPGNIVIMDNLGSHRSSAVRRVRGGRHQLFFLPKYSPDLNPIEMLFSKLKHALRKAARRAQDAKYHALRLPTAYGPAQRVCQLLRQSRIRSNLESSRSAWSDPLASCGNELRKRWPQTLAQGLLTGLLNSENKAGVDRSASRSTPEAPCWRPTMWAASCGAVAAHSKPHP